MTLAMNETMERVLAWGAEPCVSVFLPNEQGVQAANLGTVLQNLARDAERTLHDRWPMSLSDATDMVAPLRSIAARGVQIGQLPSVGLFCRAGESTSCGLPMRLDRASVSVQWGPNLLPLVAAGQTDIRHVVLALNRRKSRAVIGGSFAWEKVAIKLPSDSNLVVSHQRGLTHHGGGQGRGAILGGSGTNEHLDDELLAAHMREIDSRLRPLLSSIDLPLIVAGVEYEVSAFMAVTDHRHAFAEICGSTERMSDAEIHALGQRTLQSLNESDVSVALTRVSELGGSGRVLSDGAAIDYEARNGHIETLLVPDRLTFGEDIDAESTAAAARATLQHRGDVTVVPQERLDQVTAILRY
jgi:Bacterial archaeo-eukaryotic release factor family 3